MSRIQDPYAVSETEMRAFPSASMHPSAATWAVNYRGAFLNRLGTRRNWATLWLTRRSKLHHVRLRCCHHIAEDDAVEAVVIARD